MSKVITEYNIIKVSSPADLMKEVNSYIANGYQPYGPPHIEYTPEPYESWNYTQPMVKYQDVIIASSAKTVHGGTTLYVELNGKTLVFVRNTTKDEWEQI